MARRIRKVLSSRSHKWASNGRCLRDDVGMLYLFVECIRCGAVGKRYGNSRQVCYKQAACAP